MAENEKEPIEVEEVKKEEKQQPKKKTSNATIKKEEATQKEQPKKTEAKKEEKKDNSQFLTAAIVLTAVSVFIFVLFKILNLFTLDYSDAAVLFRKIMYFSQFACSAIALSFSVYNYIKKLDSRLNIVVLVLNICLIFL